MRVKSKDFYVLLCDDSMYNDEYDPMICGVFASRREAKECADDPAVKGCLLKHTIKKCTVLVEFKAGAKQERRAVPLRK